MPAQGVSLSGLLASLPSRRRLVVGFSGGLDSSLLLHNAQALSLACHGTPALLAVHVHHGLSRHADDWAAHAAAVCAGAGIPLQVVHVNVVADGDGPEAAARRARRAAFADVLRPGDALLLGHQADDQAETLLLRLLRGSGLDGMAAMRAWRWADGLDDVLVLRPLLGMTREQVRAQAIQAQLAWVEDDSNRSLAFDRNFLRHEILPALNTRWPAANRVLARDAGLFAEAADVLAGYVEQDLDTLCDVQGGLDIAGLMAVPSPRAAVLLRHWLQRVGAPRPGSARLADMLALAAARPDAEGHLDWAGWELHGFRGRLRAFPALPPADAMPQDWDLQGVLALGEGGGVLVAEPWQAGRAGLALGLAAGTPVRVCLRRGGERFRPVGDRHQRTLKKWLQAQGVPPWLRTRLPLLCAPDGTLLAVADRVAAVPAGGEPRLLLRWQPPLPY